MAFENMGTEITDTEYAWDGTITKDADEIVIVPDGDYDFTILNYEKQRHDATPKMPTCPKAVINIEVSNGTVKTRVRHNLFLHSRAEGMLSAFFTAIGQKKHGEPLRMNFDAAVGCTGRCKVGHREYNGKTYNQITRFYDQTKKAADSQATQQAPAWKEGSF